MSYIYGIPYWNHGSCSSEQAKGMGAWASALADSIKHTPSMFVIVGIRDSCQPPTHFALGSIAPIVWIPLETEKAVDAVEVLKGIARISKTELFLDKTSPGCPDELR